MNRTMFFTLAVCLLINSSFSAILIVDSVPKIVQIQSNQYLISFDQASPQPQSSTSSIQTSVPTASNLIVSSLEGPKTTSQTLSSTSQQKTSQTLVSGVKNIQSSTTQASSGAKGGSLNINQMLDILSSNDDTETVKKPVSIVASKPIISSNAISTTLSSQPSSPQTSTQNNSSGTSSGVPTLGLALSTESPIIGLANPLATSK